MNQPAQRLASITTDPLFERADHAARREHQAGLELLYSKNQTLRRIRAEFEESPIQFDKWAAAAELPLDFVSDLVVQMALHKRTTLSTLVGILRRHFEPDLDASQQAADALLKAAQADLVDWDETLKLFIVRFEISEDVQRDLDRFQYPLPMVVKPKSVRSNRDTGYLTTKDSLLLKKNHHDDDICLDHINRANRVAFAIDYDTAAMVQNQWRNLDHAKQGETPAEFQKRKKAFEKYDRTAKDVIGKLLVHGNRFWLTHKYDKRGRIYCQGYHVNYQGAPWNKAVIELADKEFVE